MSAIKNILDKVMPRQKQFDEQLALEKTMQLFWRQGYAGTSMKDIEKCLGLTPPSIYNAFGNKQRLFERSLHFYIERVVRQRVRTFLKVDDDPIAGIYHFFSSVIVSESEGCSRLGCLLTNSSAESNKISELIDQNIRQALEYIRTAFKMQLLLLQKRGALSLQLDLEATADSLLLNYQGLLIAVRNGYPEVTLKRYATSALACVYPFLIKHSLN